MEIWALRRQVEAMSKGRRSIALFGCVVTWAADRPSSVTFKLDFYDNLEIVRSIRGRKAGEQACGNMSTEHNYKQACGNMSTEHNL